MPVALVLAEVAVVAEAVAGDVVLLSQDTNKIVVKWLMLSVEQICLKKKDNAFFLKMHSNIENHITHCLLLTFKLDKSVMHNNIAILIIRCQKLTFRLAKSTMHNSIETLITHCQMQSVRL